MKIEDLATQYKSAEELKAYADAQYKTILNQSKEINSLKEKVQELEKLLANSTPIIQDPDAINNVHVRIAGLSDEEAVAIMEIAKLKEISLERELATDEAKKYQIYVQTLHMLKGKSKDDKGKKKIEELDDSALLDLLSKQ